MAYDPYTAVNNIYNFKGEWEAGNNEGDDAKKNNAATAAQTYYKELRDNGYGDIADQLTAADYTQAKSIRDNITTSGKTKTRDYLYSLGSGYGMSRSDIDNLIEWDSGTGEVSFGGKKIGRPDTVVDGTSYWSDTSALDNAFNDYIKRSGTTMSDSKLSSINSSEVKDKINGLWGMQTSDHDELSGLYKKEYEDLKNTNPFTTEEAKAILAKYDLSGLQARDNEVASNAGSNGGNIDSYAAANAMRQQASLINQGQMTVLDAYNQKLDHAKELLDGLGVYQQNSYAGMQNTIDQQQEEAQRLFENDETAKNNDVARKSEIASVTGYAPDEWVVSNNPYMNEDGTIKDKYKDVDFSEVMAQAKANGNTNAYNAAAAARFYKIMGNYGAFGQYDDGNYIVPEQQRTADYDLTTKQIDSAERISLNDNQTQKEIAAANNKTQENIAQIEANAAVSAQSIQTEADKYVANLAAQGASAEEIETQRNAATYDGLVKSLGYQTLLTPFLTEYVKPFFEGTTTMTHAELIEAMKKYATKYNIDVEDAELICNLLEIDTSWIKKYKNDPDNHYGGMIPK